MASSRPTLVYDGTCGICRTWVEYWRALTGDAVDYRPYQDAANDFPQISLQSFERAMQLIEPDGHVYAGAAAAFRLLTHARDRRGLSWWAYRTIPGFAGLSETAYAFLSQRRGLLAILTRALWGTPLEPARYDIVAQVFLRGLGLIYAVAFYSLCVQILALAGSNGLLPLAEYLSTAHKAWGASAYWQLPTLFWFTQSDALLVGGAWIGVALGLAVALGFFQRAALISLFVLYLSYVYAGQLFMSYQWDLLLLESGFLAIFLTSGSRIVVWLYRLLLFRFLFLAGVVKVMSGDATWQNFTALDYHFWTQPLPSPLAWYAAQLPSWLLAGSVACVLALELVGVFLIFAPRRPRLVLALLTVAFQIAIMATGNYNFFNLLTILLCVFLLDDQALRRFVPERFSARATANAPQPGPLATWTAGIVALIVVPAGLNYVWEPITGRNLPAGGAIAETIASLLIVNSYGVFATTTTTRPEIIIEGSNDARTWQPYLLPYMPGPVDRAPTWNIPYQPRLDWQMWFASYQGLQQSRWIERLLRRLLENSAPVVKLFASNPFPDAPPKFVRAQLYEYRFAEPSQSAWWTRHLDGAFFPAISLDVLQRPLQGPGASTGMPGLVPGPGQVER